LAYFGSRTIVALMILGLLSMGAGSKAGAQKTNHLASETSPYLRQHMLNPVDWHPWGAEALAKAKREGKPIFLSIGYSSCHWCHVMAHESFEDPETAVFLNDHFVAIKVDREERPDLDALYMRAVTLMTGSGGWPLSVFLTPDLKPFFGGTYFPKESRWGVRAFRQVLQSVVDAFEKDRGRVDRSAEDLLGAVARSFQSRSGEKPGTRAADDARKALLQRYDETEGGFGEGPKFPQPPLLQFLLDEADRVADPGLSEKVHFTLRAMAAGGVRDQVGGGFHRYSVDGHWRVPHYEKMLYDNAQLASLYFRAYALSGDEEFLRVAQETLADVSRSMAAPGGGFVAGLDADSDGGEGLFYLWTPNQIDAVLGTQEGKFLSGLFGVSEEPGLANRTLHLTLPWKTAAQRAGQTLPVFQHRVARDMDQLRAAREKRVNPAVDTKVLTDWNALAAQAFLDGYLSTGDPADLSVGLATLDRTWARCWSGGELRHVWDGSTAHVSGFLADYAYLAQAEWTAYEATGKEVHLRRVEMLLKTSGEKFRIKSTGAWVDAPASPEGALLIHVSSSDDGVLPAPTSVLARILWDWSRLSDVPWAAQWLEALLKSESGGLAQNPGGQPLLAGLAAWVTLPPVDVVVSAPTMAQASPLLAAARRAGSSATLVLPLTAEGLGRGEAEGLALFQQRRSEKGKPVAFVCVGGACQRPVESTANVSSSVANARTRPRHQARN
jgi:uncharacterized protein YyaL (SSP411 family)